MIRRSILAAALPLALAVPLAAQSLAPADSALLEAYLDASGQLTSTRSQTEMMESMMGSNPLTDAALGEFSPEAALDSVRAAYARDFQREPLEEAIALFRNPEIRPLVEFQQQFSGGFAEAQELFADLMVDPDAYELGDADLAREYVGALGTTERMASMMGGFMGQMMAVFPGAEAEAAAEGLAVAEYADRIIQTELLPMLDSTMVLAARYTLRDVPPEATRRLIAFYESASGEYVMETAWEGAMAGVQPMYDAMFESLGSMFDELPPPPRPPGPPEPCKKGAPGCTAREASGTPPPPSPGGNGERLGGE